MPNFYLMPTVISTGPNNEQVTTPKYAATAMLNLNYAALPFGAEGVVLVSLASPNAALVATDVYAFPSDLTQTLASVDVAALVAFVQPYNIPSSWIKAGATFQSMLTQIAQIFLCMQAISGGNPIFAGTQNTPATPLAQPLTCNVEEPAARLEEFRRQYPHCTLTAEQMNEFERQRISRWRGVSVEQLKQERYFD